MFQRRLGTGRKSRGGHDDPTTIFCVLDNITLAPRHVHRLARETCEKTALELLTVFGLDGFAGAYPEQLSCGQQQRVAIIRATANHPDVLMLDEVTAALDPELIGDVLAVIRDLKIAG